jgi:formamidopyrimidine-DNA glycosylase
MPEMPEVETIRRSLAVKLQDRRIMQVEIRLARQIKWPDTEGFKAKLVGHAFRKFDRIGKYLLFAFEDGRELAVHLRMTGRLLYEADGEVHDAYARVIFSLDNGAKLVYADTRTFGVLYALDAGERWRIHGLTEMGPEPLSKGFTTAYLQQAAQGRKSRIKNFLLDQRRIGGLGNIYVDEALFLAGIHPLREAGSLTAGELQRLHDAVNEVIAEGIADGGTTFRDYVDADGQKGGHQAHLRVYHRDGKPCCQCGTLLERIVVGGRGTHFCPVCQSLKG